MFDTNDLIAALANNKTAEANNVFNDLMGAKISDALDARKIEISDDVFNGVEQEIVDADVQRTEIESDIE
jgi:hypothetical protein